MESASLGDALNVAGVLENRSFVVRFRQKFWVWTKRRRVRGMPKNPDNTRSMAARTLKAR
jgi:hypothetical protein